MARVEQKVLRMSDGKCIHALIEFATSKAGNAFSTLQCTIHGNSALTPISLKEKERDPSLAQLLEYRGRSFESIQLKGSNEQTYVRIDREPGERGLFDKLSINTGGTTEEAAAISEAIQELFGATSAVDLGPLLGPQVAEHFIAREEALTRLQSAIEQAADRVLDMQQQLNQAHSARMQTLEGEYANRKKLLETDHAEKLADFEKREAKIAEDMAHLDNRSNREVRRELRKDLKNAMTKSGRFKVSAEASKRRWGVFAFYVLLLAFFGGPFLYLFWKVAIPESFDPYQFATRTGLAIGFLVTMAFLLRWLNTWATKTTDEEFKLKQMELDIDRASWIVELILEAQATPGTVSPELIDRLSRNLFLSSESPNHAMTAADALASALLHSAASAELPMFGANFKFNKKSIRDLDKQSIGDSE